jgi:hypothetical protein
MANNIHKGTELNNVQETWNENERRDGGTSGRTGDAGMVNDDLKQVIREEAAEYDRQDREDSMLGGDRAAVRDEDGEQ